MSRTPCDRGRSQPTLADTGRPAQDQIVVRVDPFADGKLLEQGGVEVTRGAVVIVLDDGVLARTRIAQTGSEPLVTAMRKLAIEQQPKPVGVAERRGVDGGFQFGEGLGHAGEAELVQLVERRVGEQLGSP